MLKKWMLAQERALHQVDTNRRVRPFVWGIDWVDGKADARNPLEFFHTYSEQALANSQEFFTPAPTDQYSVRGDILIFPSAIKSPYEENNTAYYRIFPVKSNGKAVIVVPQWNADAEGHVALCRLINRFGITAMRLSLPYHDQRKPPELDRADYLVSSNIGQTLQANRQAVLDVRRAADWLEKQGYNKLAVLGTSVGSCIAFLAFAHEDRFKVGVFNHVSTYYGDVVWLGISTSHVRDGIEGNITQDELRKFWAPISPKPFVRKLKGKNKHSLLISAKYDLTFPPELSRQTRLEYESHDIPYDKIILPCGHYTIGRFPFNWIDGLIMANYLRKKLR